MPDSPPPVQLRLLADLKRDPNNARTHSPEQTEMVAASIRRFGWTNPMVVDDVIRAGNCRADAAQLIYDAGETIYLAPGKDRGGQALPEGTVPIIDCTGWTEEERTAYGLGDNQLALQAGWNEDLLREQLDALAAVDFDFASIGFDEAAIEALAKAGEDSGRTKPLGLVGEFMIPPFSVLNAREGWWQERKRQWISLGIKSELGRGENLLKMSDTMLEPDPEKRAAMQAGRRLAETYAPDALASRAQIRGDKDSQYGQPRSAQRGITFGTGSASGDDREPGETTGDRIFRGTKGRKPGLGGVTMDALSSHPRYYEQKTAAERRLGRQLSNEEFERDHWVLPDSDLSSGTSIFDPTLCELAYRWFSPVGGRVLDPFAGGSVRGIVAAALGRQYVGVDLRAEQVEANRLQWPGVADRLGTASAGPEVPPLDVEEIEGIRVVRDDRVLGGTKRRALDLVLAQLDATELIYATPAQGFAQIALAYAARAAGKKATIVVAQRTQLHPRTRLAAAAGAEIVEVPAGRLNVIQARSRALAKERGAYLVPFGMDDQIFVDAIAEVARSLPGDAPAEVWSVAGSGVLTRALQQAWPEARFHAVQIGRNPEVGAAQLWKAPEKFEEDAAEPPPFPSCGNYDAKAWAFIRQHAQPGALFWNVGADLPEAVGPAPEPQWHTGDSALVLAEGGDEDQIGDGFDLIFSCPPYGDLEVYSEDPADISTLEMAEFDRVYADIVAKAVARLGDNRFACFVVGDYRDKRGIYANFVSKTIAAFEAAGARLYNEAILVTSVGSLPIRAAKQFRTTRKLGKTHQNILVFIKGDPRKATEACGLVDVADSLIGIEPDDEGLEAPEAEQIGSADSESHDGE